MSTTLPTLPTYPRCATCKYWHHRPPNVRGDCMRGDEDDGDDIPVEPYISTESMYGCVLWQAKS